MVTRGSAVKPGDVTVMAWVEPWPAMKPTASSPAAPGVTDPEDAAVLVAGGSQPTCRADWWWPRR